ncbi:tRNA glutamyl-Q(34) synthetase GluQRS [Thioalkalivibrio sp. XN8]|nr:tRNA glutamyl-Q(34) synthetase GluQRS [Thioalkalivibrio sp. XN8]
MATATSAELPTGQPSPAEPPVGAYRGRFAPSPTGPLHFGSLLAAAASWLDARAAGGEWLLRIEDIDPPREQPGATEAILRALDILGLHWDGPVAFQGCRQEAFNAALTRLHESGWAYACECSRADIAAANAGRGRPEDRRYPGTCRELGLGTDRAPVLRVRTAADELGIDDRLQGWFSQQLETETGDFVVRRRDGLIAYQLAVVVDDADAGITDIVRGIDLLDSTPRQLWLQQLLGLPRPRYMHLPVIVTPTGEKLSKQTGAAALDLRRAGELAWLALDSLGLAPPDALRGAPPAEQWSWAVGRWDPQHLAGRRSIPAPAKL